MSGLRNTRNEMEFSRDGSVVVGVDRAESEPETGRPIEPALHLQQQNSVVMLSSDTAKDPSCLQYCGMQNGPALLEDTLAISLRNKLATVSQYRKDDQSDLGQI